MKRTVILILCAVTVLFLPSCRKKLLDISHTTDGESIMSDTDTIINEPQSFRVDNILDAVGWLGKGDDEISVPGEYISNEGTFKEIRIDGRLFSHECRGYARYAFLGEDKDKYVESIYLFVDDYSPDECKKEFEKLFGEPVNERENPYAESVGGVVSRTDYETDKYTISLESASNYSFFTLEFRLKNGQN